MQSISNANFGPLIAYLVPGATALWGLSRFSPAVAAWFAATPADAPTISGFLYLTVASLAVGMTVTAVRWAFVDLLHSVTGLRPPELNFSRLAGKVDALNLLIEIHYRHYQFYANMLVATAFAFVCYRISPGQTIGIGAPDYAVAALELIFFATSRDTPQILPPEDAARVEAGGAALPAGSCRSEAASDSQNATLDSSGATQFRCHTATILFKPAARLYNFVGSHTFPGGNKMWLANSSRRTI